MLLFPDKKGPLLKILMALHETLTRASKTPKKENPTKSPKVPPSSATWELRYILLDYWRSSVRVSNGDNGHQWGEGVDELLHLVPDIVWHLWLDGQGLPSLVGDSPQGEYKIVKFHSCCLLLVGKAILPVCTTFYQTRSVGRLRLPKF